MRCSRSAPCGQAAGQVAAASRTGGRAETARRMTGAPRIGGLAGGVHLGLWASRATRDGPIRLLTDTRRAYSRLCGPRLPVSSGLQGAAARQHRSATTCPAGAGWPQCRILDATSARIGALSRPALQAAALRRRSAMHARCRSERQAGTGVTIADGLCRLHAARPCRVGSCCTLP